MKRRSFFLLIAAGLASVSLLAAPASVHANLVPVFTDSGGGSVNVVGTADGADITSIIESINVINGSPVTPTLPLASTVQVTYSGDNLFSGSGSKTIGSPGNEAVLDFTITSGFLTPNGLGLFLFGTITSVPLGTVTSGSDTYDFSYLLGGGITLTATSLQGSFLGVLKNPGAAIEAGAGVYQAAVPEPATLAFFGIGMTGIIVFRHRFRKASVA